MQARRILAIAMVAMVVAAGTAAPATAATGDASETSVTVVVQNNNIRAVTVYAVTDAGKLRLLGRVGSAGERSFEVPEALLQDGKLQIKVSHPKGPGGLTYGVLQRNEAIRTHPIPVESGTKVGLWVDRDLRASRVFVEAA